MSALFIETLGQERKAVFGKLAQFSPDFVLAGGTAIMLQLNHRLSYDFDCFSQKPIKKTLRREAVEIFGKDIKVNIDNSDILQFITPKKVEVTFVFNPYPPLHPLVRSESISLFNLADLATDKARTLGRRGVWRDYVDIFFFLKWEIFSLEQIIKEAEERFKAGEFHDKLFLEQLTYYDDLEIVPVNFLQEKYSPEEIQKFLQDEVSKQITTLIKFNERG